MFPSGKVQQIHVLCGIRSMCECVRLLHGVSRVVQEWKDPHWHWNTEARFFITRLSAAFRLWGRLCCCCLIYPPPPSLSLSPYVSLPCVYITVYDHWALYLILFTLYVSPTLPRNDLKRYINNIIPRANIHRAACIDRHCCRYHRHNFALDVTTLFGFEQSLMKLFYKMGLYTWLLLVVACNGSVVKIFCLVKPGSMWTDSVSQPRLNVFFLTI